MIIHSDVSSTDTNLIIAIDRACTQIPPLWPLESSVAVNPFLGQGAQGLASVAAQLGRIHSVGLFMPRAWYQEKISSGFITDADLSEALASSLHKEKPASLAELKLLARQPSELAKPYPTIAALASQHTGRDWSDLIEDRFGLWAGGLFDRGQATWTATSQHGVWKSWRSWAAYDLTPEIRGLKGFASFADNLPDTAIEALKRSTKRLGLSDSAMESYFHQLLLSLGGWAQFARRQLWDAELAGTTDQTLQDFLAIRLCWEEALYSQFEDALAKDWSAIIEKHAAPITVPRSLIVDEILQEATERAGQRKLQDSLSGSGGRSPSGRPELQAAFCIDVRSEVFRRALESLDPKIETLGFAGFFGLRIEHRSFASETLEHRFPVLLTGQIHTSSGLAAGNNREEAQTRVAGRAKRAWGRFKLAAVSSFAFVEAMGPAYLGKLMSSSLRLPSGHGPASRSPHFDDSLTLGERIDAAETILRAMSLSGNFAKVVVLVGHGANVVNNPMASALHCGACGGYSGEVNARLLASLLNERPVRDGLKERGIDVPTDTVFVGALHDTTTDTITVFDGELPPHADGTQLSRVRNWFATAGRMANAERIARLPRANSPDDVAVRARNWAELRPEWGLAGCNAFIAAPRSRTAGLALGGRAFLHSYDCKQDQERDYRVLELVMTAPVVVASWISLQYYGSCVAPETFGAGNKTLHNVVGGFGVLEGNGGNLRGGLAWQSVYDGEKLAHEPLRLSVCIEAPPESMTAILKRHESIRSLFDNRWMHLLAIDENGRLAWRYAGNLTWEAIEEIPTAELKAAS